jgi:hypothetical protein
MVLSRLLVPAIILAVGAATLVLHGRQILTATQTTHVAGAELVDYRPAGEIVSGLLIEQHFRVDDPMVSAPDATRPCMGLLLATYSDRRNRGRMTVTVTVDGLSESHSVAFRRVADNMRHMICLREIRFGHIRDAGGFELAIRGVKGRPGRSITAWLTAETRFGTARIDGEDTGASLLVSLHERDFGRPLVIAGSGLFILMLIAIGVILRFIQHGPGKRCAN